MSSATDLAKDILLESLNASSASTFKAVRRSERFPPRPLLNEFLMVGEDPCDPNHRRWPPFALSDDEYAAVKGWWIGLNPGATEDALGAESWDDWFSLVLGA